MSKNKPQTIADLDLSKCSLCYSNFDKHFAANFHSYLNFKIKPGVYKIYVNNEYCCCDIPLTIYIYQDYNTLAFFLERLSTMILAMYGSGSFKFGKFDKLNNNTYVLNIRPVEESKV